MIKLGKRVFLNVCVSCHGYTPDEDLTECPVCGGELSFRPIDIKDKSTYKKLEDMDNDRSNSGKNEQFDDPFDESFSAPMNYDSKSDNGSSSTSEEFFVHRPQNNDHSRLTSVNNDQSFTGIVYNYKNSDNDGSKYSRLLIMKLWDAVVYKQRMEDVLHYFRLHTSSGKDLDGMEISKNINVNVHGTIIGGAHLADNSRLTVRGKFKNGVLMASEITDDDSGSHIRFRRSYKAIATTVVISILFLFGLIHCITSSSSIGDFFHNIGTFFWTLIIVYVVLLVIYFIASFTKFGIIMRAVSQKKMSIPWLALFIIAFAITILIMSNMSGIGSGLSSLREILSAIFLYAIIIFGIVLIFKSMK